MNIAEILKYCPKGTKLYSLVDGEVTLKKVTDIGACPILVEVEDGTHKYYTRYGLHFTSRSGGECVLFPSKEQRDWNKFRIPVKRGDVMMLTDGTCPFIATGELYNDISPKCICGIDLADNIRTGFNEEGGWASDFYIPASEEAKKKLFDKIVKAGYRWNADTLELEEIQRFKPFDKVLVRDFPSQKWSISLFSYYDKEDISYPYVCLNSRYSYCIPYKGHECLVGTTINPPHMG